MKQVNMRRLAATLFFVYAIIGCIGGDHGHASSEPIPTTESGSVNGAEQKNFDSDKIGVALNGLPPDLIEEYRALNKIGKVSVSDADEFARNMWFLLAKMPDLLRSDYGKYVASVDGEIFIEEDFSTLKDFLWMNYRQRFFAFVQISWPIRTEVHFER